MATPTFIRSSAPAQNRRNLLCEIFRPLLPSIARSVARRLPASFNTDDLEQTGIVALLEEIPHIEAQLRMRIEGAMWDSTKGPAYREATHAQISKVVDAVDPSRSALTILIDEEWAAGIRNVVKCLPRDQVEAIDARFSGDSRPEGRPGLGPRGVALRKAVNVLRPVLLAKVA